MNGLENFLQAAIDLLAELLVVLWPLIIPAVLVFARQVAETYNRNVPENIRSAIYDAAELGVDFAEAMGLQGRLSEYGHNKFHLALDVAERSLNEQGYPNVNLDTLGATIESILFSNPEVYHSTNREVG